MSAPTDDTTRDLLALDYNGWLFRQHSTKEQAQLRPSSRSRVAEDTPEPPLSTLEIGRPKRQAS